MNRPSLTAVGLALLLVSGSAFADDGWRFRLAPYIWLAGLKGDVGTIPPLPAASVDIPWSDALKDTNGGAMILFEGKKQRHGFMVDLLYTDVRSDTTLVPPPINLNMRSISKTTIATVAYQYELYRQDQTAVDLLAGLRYWQINSELQFSGGLGLLAGRSISNTESWVDPAVGVKGRAPFGNSRFYFEGAAGIGGFGAGSSLFYEINLNVGYQWTKSIGTTIGYRMFDVDYENDGYVYDVKQQGWQLGLSWAL